MSLATALLPLSAFQKFIIHNQLLTPKSPLYHSGFILRLSGEVQHDIVQQAFERLSAEQPCLRSVIIKKSVIIKPNVVVKKSDGSTPEYQQQVLAKATNSFQFINCQKASSPEEESKAALQTVFEQPFDLSVSSFRCCLVQIAEDEYKLLLCYHQLFADRASGTLLLEQLVTHYDALANIESNIGRENTLTPSEIDTTYHALFTTHPVNLTPKTPQESATYWQRVLLGMPEALFQNRYSHAELPQSHYQQMTISRAQHCALTALSVSKKGSWQHVFVSLVAVYFARLNNRSEVLIGVPVDDHNDAHNTGIAGAFSSILPLRISINPEHSVAEVMMQVAENYSASVSHRHFPLLEIQQLCKQSAESSRAQLFDVIITSQTLCSTGAFCADIEGKEGCYQLSHVQNRYQQAPIMLNLIDDIAADNLRIELNGDSAFFSATDLQIIAGTLSRLITELPSTIDGEISLVSAAEKQQILADFNGPTVQYHGEATIHERFQARVAETPDAIAVVHCDFDARNEQISYATLNAKANQVAHFLRKKGIKPNTLVGIFAERSPRFLIAILGVMKSGAAYVPLDPINPQDRIDTMIANAGASVLFVEPALMARLGKQAKVVTLVNLSELDAELANYSTENPAIVNTGDDLAYMIYTSGSTGVPKGALVHHAGALNHIDAEFDVLGFMPEDKSHLLPKNFLQSAASSSDVSVWQFLAPAVSGGQTVILNDMTNVSLMVRLLQAFDVHLMQAAPVVLQLMVEHIQKMPTAARELPALQWMMAIAEALPVPVLNSWLILYPNIPVMNGYGPSEASDDITEFVLDKLLPEATPSIPIGRPIPNLTMYVLDSQLRLLPIGVAGELCVSGVGVGPGYWQNPIKTNDVFVPNPYAGQHGVHGDRLYRTGDLGRWLPNGTLEFMGRIDNQVKVRGFRIELGEIEAAIAQIHGVADVAVLAVNDHQGQTALAAYMTRKNVNGERCVQIDDIYAHLEAKLPDYMLPASFNWMDKMPLNAADKIDRRRLPKPDFATDLAARYVAPTNEIENQLCHLWQEVLALPQIGITDHFFRIGGHSLLAVNMAVSVQEALGITLPVSQIFALPTIKQLAEFIHTQSQHAQHIKLTARLANTELTALSFAQQRLWIVDQLNGQSPQYNLPVALRVTGNFDVAAAEQAFAAIIARHEVLRSVYVEQDGDVLQHIRESVSFALQQVDLREQAYEVAETALNKLAAEEAVKPFDLKNDLMLRAIFVHLPEACSSSLTSPTSPTSPTKQVKGALLINMHHIASDGWSEGVLNREFSALYAAAVHHKVVRLPPLAVQYADFALWQRESLGGDKLAPQLEYWRQQLAGVAEVHSIALDFPRPAVKTHHAGKVISKVSKNVRQKLQQLAAQHDLTEFMLLHGMFALVLSRHSNSQDIVIGTPVANRTHTDLADLIGFFVNTLVLRTRTDWPTMAEFLAHVREVNIQAQTHQDVPFEQLVELCRVVRTAQYSPLFQVSFSLDNNAYQALSLPEVTLGELAADVHVTKFDLEVSVNSAESMDRHDEHGELSITWLYDRSIFAPNRVEAMSAHLENLLCAVVENPTGSPATLPILTQQERAFLFEEFNSVPTVKPEAFPLHQRFSERAAQFPEHTAVVCEQQRLSYQALDKRANKLAHYLQQQITGAASDCALIGLCMARSIDMVVGLLAILKIGKAYVPIDKDAPPARIQHIVEDARLAFVLSQREVASALQGLKVNVLCIDERDVKLQQYADSCPHIDTKPSDSAYVIYTSGSTGQPKGVLQTHENAARLFSATQDEFQFTAEDVWTLFHSIAFDFSVWELWGALLFGGKLVIPSYNETRDTDAFIILCEKEGVTVLNQTPSAFKLFMQQTLTNGFSLSTLRYVIFGGEALQVASLEPWWQAFPANKPQLVNMFGITETTVHVTHKALTPQDAEHSVIGQPLPDQQIYLLDEYRQPVPLGAVGEIYVGGAGLARGYLHQPELSESRFIDNPFTNEVMRRHGYLRMYKTGDLARFTHDGQLVYLGRNDDQVKVRGFRIELGEITQQFLALDYVKDAHIRLFKRQDVAPELVAYIEVKQGKNPDVTQHWRRDVEGSLPSYMIPSALVEVNDWPLTVNGKIDWQRLPTPQHASTTDYEAPKTQNEQVLAQAWAQVLPLDASSISRRDNFYALGGHSLLLIKLRSILAEQGVELTFSALYQAPDLRALAASLTAAEQRAAPKSHVPVDCTELTPEMFGLLQLPVAELARISGKVPGGAANVQDIYGLSPLQKGMLFHALLTPEYDPYIIKTVFKCESRQASEQFCMALGKVIQRHDALRTLVVHHGVAEPVQVVCKQVELPITWVSLPSNIGNITQFFEEYGADGSTVNGVELVPIDRAPLIHLHGFSHESGIYLAMFNHHLCEDNLSLRIIESELQRFMVDPAKQLPAVTQYREFIWQSIQQDSQQARAFFTKQLSGVDSPSLPYHVDAKSTLSAAPTIVEAPLPLDVVNALKALASKQKITLATLLHLAWAIVVGRTSGKTDVVFGSVMSGRMQPIDGIDTLVGLCINTLPLRVNIAQSVEGCLREVHSALNQLAVYEQSSLADIQACSDMEENTPLFNCILNCRMQYSSGDGIGERSDDRAAQKTPYTGISTLVEQEGTNYPLSASVDYSEQAISINITTTHDIPAESVLQYFQRALVALSQVDSHQDYSLDVTNAYELDVLTEQETAFLFEQFNTVPTMASERFVLHQRFSEQAQQHPEHIAVVCGQRSLTYHALEQQSNQLAQYLFEHSPSAKNGDSHSMIGLCMERSIDMVIALLAILKAGKVYVPIDKNAPPARIKHIVEDAQLSVVLSQSSVASLLQNLDVSVLCIDALPVQLSQYADACPTVNDDAADAAYVIYTSGSTGKPKGVLQTHENVARLFSCTKTEFGFGSADVWTLFHSVAFDFSVWELWGALLFGGKLVIPSYAETRDTDAFIALCEAQAVTVLNQTPSAFKLFMQQVLENQHRLPALRTVIFGGEALQVASLTPWWEVFPVDAPQLVNMFGITETTVHVTLKKLTPQDVAHSVIGQPLADQQIYLLNEQLQPVPLGAEGEIFVGGAGLAQGYLHQPELSDARFIDNPFATVLMRQRGQHKMYRSGDLARFTPAGELVYLGRNDDQVKVRGFRIELGEIAQQTLALPYVKDAHIRLLKRDNAEPEIVAYIEAKQDVAQSEVQGWREDLEAKLPSYMLPSAMLLVSDWPLTVNGKIDWKQLPTPQYVGHSNFEAPITKNEKLLAQAWAQVLSVQVNKISRHDNFYGLGGHSLLLIQLRAILAQQGVELAFGALYQAPDLRALAELLTLAEQRVAPLTIIPTNCTKLTSDMFGLCAVSETDLDVICAHVAAIYAETSINSTDVDVDTSRSSNHSVKHYVSESQLSKNELFERELTEREIAKRDVATFNAESTCSAANIADIYGLSPLQKGMLFHSLTGPERDAYVIKSVFRCDSQAHAERYCAALEYVIQRHDALRTLIVHRGIAEPLQVVCKQVPLPIAWLTPPDSVETVDEMTQFLADYYPVNTLLIPIERAPLMNVHGFKHHTGIYLVRFNHHLCEDNLSMRIVESELDEFMLGNLQASAPAAQYREFIWQSQQIDSQQAKAFFTEYLAGFDTPSLPYGVDGKLDADAATSPIVVNQSLPTQVVDDLRKLASLQQTTLATLLHVAWAIVVARTSGKTDIAFGSVMSGRMQPIDGIERIVGLCINTLPLRVNTAQSIAACLHDVREALNQFVAYEQTSLADIQTWSDLSANMPLFNCILNCRMQYADSAQLNPTEVVASPNSQQTGITTLIEQEATNYPLSASVDYSEHDIAINITATQGIPAKSLLSQFQCALVALSRLPNCGNQEKAEAFNAYELGILSESEKAQLLQHCSPENTQTSAEHLLTRFEHHAQHIPDFTAVVFQAQALTYAQLNKRANQLAQLLLTRGLARENLVAICMPRSVDMIVAALAIMKAGGAYVPLDPSYPSARLQHMLHDSGVKLVLCCVKHCVDIPIGSHHEVIAIDSQQTQTQLADFTSEAPILTPPSSEHDLAYVIYTSGSTGLPKGVMLAHAGLANLAQHTVERCHLRAGTAMLNLASFGFDAATWDWCSAMYAGATLHLASDAVRLSPDALAEYVKAYQIEYAFIPPALLETLPEEQFASLRTICVGGEAPNKELLIRWAQGSEQHKRQVFNAYGPTETTVVATIKRISADQKTLTIGKPLPNVHCVILDSQQQLTPLGAVGELYIGGVGVARGYLNRSELTVESFVTLPEMNNAVFYRSGDLVRLLTNGEFEFIGRADDQVSIRGYRVELGEIENQLTHQAHVASAVVCAQQAENQRTQLFAFVKTNLPTNAWQPVQQGIKTHLQNTLPDYMVPEQIIAIENWPLTPSGKVDKRALVKQVADAPREVYVAPANVTEQTLVNIWAQVLALPSGQISRYAHFFELGGHSILAIKLLTGINQTFASQLTLKDIYRHASLQKMADVIEAQTTTIFKNSATSPLNDDQTQASLQLVNIPVFLLPELSGVWRDTQSLASACEGKLALYCLEQNALSTNAEQVITHYAKQITQQVQGEECVIAGYSLGGLWAVAIVEKLQALGLNIKQLVLIEGSAQPYVQDNTNSVLDTLARDLLHSNRANFPTEFDIGDTKITPEKLADYMELSMKSEKSNRDTALLEHLQFMQQNALLAANLSLPPLVNLPVTYLATQSMMHPENLAKLQWWQQQYPQLVLVDLTEVCSATHESIVLQDAEVLTNTIVGLVE